MKQSQPQLPEGLADRGIGVQAVCFTLTGCVCVAILQLFHGSDFWVYQWFERAAVDLYWTFIVPLAALFDWGRKMFERGKAIREAKKAELVEQATQNGVQQGIRLGSQDENLRIKKLLESRGVALPPEIADEAFGKEPQNGT